MPVWLRNSKPISKALLVAGLLAASAAQATAQSCLPMGPGDVYRFAQQAEAPFLIFEGEVTFDESLLPGGAPDTPRAAVGQVDVPAHFTGLLLGKRMFDQRVEGDMVLEAHCSGGWCGSLQSGTRYLFFARQIEGRGVVAVLDPCSSFFFDAIGGRPGDIILQCHNGGACPSKLPDRLDGAEAPPDSE